MNCQQLRALCVENYECCVLQSAVPRRTNLLTSFCTQTLCTSGMFWELALAVVIFNAFKHVKDVITRRAGKCGTKKGGSR